MSNAAKRGRPSKRDVNALNDEESTSDQPTEKSVKREEEPVPSAQISHLQQETKKEKIELELENDALKAKNNKLRKEKADQARAVMTQESAADLIDRMEMIGKMSFMDLPDDIHIRFFKDLDFHSGLKLRSNKRLDKLHQYVKKEMDVFNLNIYSNCYRLKLSDYSDYYLVDTPPSRQFRNFDLLVEGLNRLSLNTTVTRFFIVSETNEHNCRIIEALSNFEIDEIRVSLRRNHQLLLPPLNLSILLNFTKNVREVLLSFPCTSISVQDLCTLRKVMLEGECKLENFDMKIEPEMEKLFVKECFGVTIEEGHGIRTRIFRTADESVEFYGSAFFTYYHYEDGLETSISDYSLLLCKKDGIVKNDFKKIKLNHLYSRD